MRKLDIFYEMYPEFLEKIHDIGNADLEDIGSNYDVVYFQPDMSSDTHYPYKEEKAFAELEKIYPICFSDIEKTSNGYKTEWYVLLSMKDV